MTIHFRTPMRMTVMKVEVEKKDPVPGIATHDVQVQGKCVPTWAMRAKVMTARTDTRLRGTGGVIEVGSHGAGPTT